MKSRLNKRFFIWVKKINYELFCSMINIDNTTLLLRVQLNRESEKYVLKREIK